MAYEMIGGILRDIKAEMIAYNRKWAEIEKASKNIRPSRIAQCCARHELEPDEFYTAEEKAVIMYPFECKPLQ